MGIQIEFNPDLAKLITAKEGMREIKDVNKKLEHELANCL